MSITFNIALRWKLLLFNFLFVVGGCPLRGDRTCDIIILSFQGNDEMRTRRNFDKPLFLFNLYNSFYHRSSRSQ